MNKSELIQQVADDAELSRAQAARIVNLLFDPTSGVIAKAIKKGETVSITGFGNFEQRARGARRRSRNRPNCRRAVGAPPEHFRRPCSTKACE